MVNGTTAGWGINTALRQKGSQHCTTAGRGINTAPRQDRETTRQVGSQHGTTAGRGVNTALRQDGETRHYKTWYYGRTGINKALWRYGQLTRHYGSTGSQHGTTAGINNEFQSTVHKCIWECYSFEISGLLINVVKNSILLEYDALSLGE
jgi:hypothetical protein